MINKETIRAAIVDTLYEKNINIDVPNVFSAFIDEVSKVTISGFFTIPGREAIMTALVKDYRKAGTDENIGSSTEMILDIIILLWTHLKLRGVTDEDLNNLVNTPDEVIKNSSFPNEYKDMYNLNTNLLFNLVYIIRLNIAYIKNSIIDMPMLYAADPNVRK